MNIIYPILLIGIVGMMNDMLCMELDKFNDIKKELNTAVSNGDLNEAINDVQELHYYLLKNYRFDEAKQEELCNLLFNDNSIQEAIKSKNLALICFIVQCAGKELKDYLSTNKQDWSDIFLSFPSYLKIKQNIDRAIEDANIFELNKAINSLSQTLTSDYKHAFKEGISKLPNDPRTVIAKRWQHALYESFSSEYELIDAVNEFYIVNAFNNDRLAKALQKLYETESVEKHNDYVEILFEILKASKTNICIFFENSFDISKDNLATKIKNKLLKLKSDQFNRLTTRFVNLISKFKSELSKSEASDKECLNKIIYDYVAYVFFSAADKAISSKNLSMAYLILYKLIHQIRINTEIISATQLEELLQRFYGLNNSLIKNLLIKFAVRFIEYALLEERNKLEGKILFPVLDYLQNIGFSRNDIEQNIGIALADVSRRMISIEIKKLEMLLDSTGQYDTYKHVLNRRKLFNELINSISTENVNNAEATINRLIQWDHHWLLSETDLDGDEPLKLAIQRHNPEFALVKLLVEKKANVNHQGYFGITPLMAAAARADLKVVQLLLKYGADPEIKDIYGDDALYYANRPMDELLYPQKIKEYADIKKLLDAALKNKVKNTSQTFELSEQINILKELNAGLNSLANKVI